MSPRVTKSDNPESGTDNLITEKIPAIPISIKGCKLFDIAQDPYIELYILYYVSCQLHLLLCKNLNYKCNSICWSLHRHIGLLVHLNIAVSFYISIKAR